MGRTPCCEKMGLKKGPWSHDEDQILISYIQQHGHGNWRALPKQAGLLRCGKSCRLRWTNYLRPDIKRGNFTKEEEDTIINLHQMLGNRWSMIAAKLPGRTDNEIKNVWHTHLKKKLSNYHTATQLSKKRHLSATKSEPGSSDPSNQAEQELAIAQSSTQLETSCLEEPPVSPQQSSSELSSVTEATTDSSSLVKYEKMDYPSESFIDESFWSEELSGKETSMVETNLTDSSELGFSFPPFTSVDGIEDTRNPNNDDGMDFWYDIFMGAEQLPELPEF